jgi:hypothetical protein
MKASSAYEHLLSNRRTSTPDFLRAGLKLDAGRKFPRETLLLPHAFYNRAVPSHQLEGHHAPGILPERELAWARGR